MFLTLKNKSYLEMLTGRVYLINPLYQPLIVEGPYYMFITPFKYPVMSFNLVLGEILRTGL